MSNKAKEFFKDWKSAAENLSDQASTVDKGFGALF